MRTNKTGETSPEGLYRSIVEQDMPDEMRNNAIEDYLETESLPAHLAYSIGESGDRYVPDFMWLYHGHPLTAGYNDQLLPPIERNGHAYTKTLASGITEGCVYLHVREAADPSLAPDDPDRYFVATLNLTVPKTREWRVARVDREERELSYRGQRFVRTELFLSDGLRSLPAGQEQDAAQAAGVRARKLGRLLTQQAFQRMPRVVLGHQGVEFIHDGLSERTVYSVAEVNRGAERIEDLQRKFGHLPIWSAQQSFSQEIAS